MIYPSSVAQRPVSRGESLIWVIAGSLAIVDAASLRHPDQGGSTRFFLAKNVCGWSQAGAAHNF